MCDLQDFSFGPELSKLDQMNDNEAVLFLSQSLVFTECRRRSKLRTTVM